MAISYYDFKNLSGQSQQELVLSEGRLISESSKDGLKILLYDMSSFCVEIISLINSDKTLSISAFQKKSVND